MATNLTGLTGQIVLQANIVAKKDDLVAKSSDVINHTSLFTLNFDNNPGTEPNGENQIYRTRLEVGDVVTQLDLTNLINPFGGAVNFSRITAIIIANVSGDGAEIVWDMDGSNAWHGPFGQDVVDVIIPDGSFVVFTDHTESIRWIVDGSNKTIELREDGTGTATCDIIIVGVE